jgi:hypothetical protein
MPVAILGLSSASSLQLQPAPMLAGYDTDIICADTPPEVEKPRKARGRHLAVHSAVVLAHQGGEAFDDISVASPGKLGA